MENYILLQDLPYAKKGTTVFYNCKHGCNRYEIQSEFNPGFKCFSLSEITRNPEWFMKESEYNKKQEELKKRMEQMTNNPIILTSKSEAEIERDVYKSLCENYMTKHITRYEESQVEAAQSIAKQLMEENKALNLTVDNLNEKLNRLTAEKEFQHEAAVNFRERLQRIEADAQQRYEAAITSFRWNKKIQNIEYLEFRKIIRLALGLDPITNTENDKYEEANKRYLQAIDYCNNNKNTFQTIEGIQNALKIAAGI